MQLTTYFGLGVLGVVALVVGLRLLLLSSRTRRLPEFLIGLAVLSGVILRRGPLAAALALGFLPETLQVGLSMGGRFMLAICCLWSCVSFVDTYKLWSEGVHDAEESFSLPGGAAA